MRTLQQEFSGIEIGRSSQFRNLTLFPLIRRSVPIQELDYLLLEDGIAQGKVRVTELQAGGSVPELRLENNAELPVLLVDGEELVGAKQNRVLNLTILAPAKHTTVIPVSCVEAGRWKMASPDLKPDCHVMYSGIRAKRVFQVTASMRSNGTRKSDQGAVWSSVRHRCATSWIGPFRSSGSHAQVLSKTSSQLCLGCTGCGARDKRTARYRNAKRVCCPDRRSPEFF